MSIFGVIRMELCGGCAATIDEWRPGWVATRETVPKNDKVVCEHCGRRRYGGMHRIREADDAR